MAAVIETCFDCSSPWTWLGFWASFSQDIQKGEVKDLLRANTDELIARGGFASPAFFIGDDMCFGDDRLGLVRRAAFSAS